MNATQLISDLALILGAAGLGSLIFRGLGQPAVIGQIIAGTIVGQKTEVIESLGQLGVILLLFNLGLEFSFRKLKRVGGTALVIATFEVVLMGVLGYFSARKLLGWSSNDSIYMASILAISSTTVTIKVLESLKLQTHRFAQTVFAVLIAEDLFAIIALIGLTAITTARSIDSTELLGSLVRLAMIVPVWFVAGVFALPYFFNKFRRFIDRETLILISGGLCFLLVIFANNLGYSPGLAAFVMGAILSETSEGKRISHSIGPLRDFFGGIFFVTVGMALDFSILKDNWITILSLVVILTVGKTVLVSFISMIVGLGIKSSVRTGFSLAQIGEFSFIIAVLGRDTQFTQRPLVAISAAVALVTCCLAPLRVRLSEWASQKIERRLPHRLRVWIERSAQTNSKKVRSPLQAAFGAIKSWLMNLILASAIFLSIKGMASLKLFSPVVAAFLASGISIPFVFGMISSAKGKLGIFLKVGALVAAIFLIRSLEVDNGVTLSCLGVIFGGIGLFRELVKLIYGRLVHIFVSNVEGKYRKFMPWDAHLAELTVHSDSACMGKKYVEVGLRSHFGITIVAIERGRQEIIAPGPEEIFFPGDILIVHGTDEQIEKFSGWIETRQDLTGLDSREFGLAELVIGQKSILCGKTIQEARLREDYSSLLVGAEKGGDRVFSPGSDLKIDVGDVLWLVGKRVDLDRILARFG